MTATLTPSDSATLTLRTDVTGRASKMGHRLTLVIDDWTVTYDTDGAAPTSVDVRVVVDSLEVTDGEGGVTPMFGPAKALARSNALEALGSDTYPEIRFRSTDITATGGGYRVVGALEIRGVSHEHTVDVAVSGDEVALRTSVAQTAFGIKPYSQMMGAMKVVDEVDVEFRAVMR